MSRSPRPAFAMRRATAADGDDLAVIHAASFPHAWSPAEFAALLAQPGTHAVIAHRTNALGLRKPAGFILYRVVSDEAEILTVAVTPASRRRGLGRALIEDALRHAYRAGAGRMHLEVDEMNRAAIALYQRLEFRESGRRKGYYAQGRAEPAAALVMLRQLR